MNFEKWDEDRYSEYIKDIEIARKELVNMKLFPKHGILCDLYAIPSHNYQAYYAIVYESNDRLNLVYAKPEIYTNNFAEPIKMYSFNYAKKAECHPIVEGRIIMGIKTLSPKFASIIRDIAINMPNEHILGENLIIVDGVFQGVRFFEEGKVVKQIVYRETDKIILPKEKEYLKKVLDNLYVEVGKIINQETKNTI